MLSIGKVGGGQGDPRYYIDSVAKGQEDYYSGSGEADGEWLGTGAASKGLTRKVSEEDFLGALRVEPGSQRTVLGFDLTFSAPKSVSVLYGIADSEIACKTRDAHDEAVRQALDYLERHACWTRRGLGGRNRLEGDGLVVAAFRHRTSRAGDPQLHTHAVIANTTRARNRWSALDGRALYAHGRTAGFIYQAVLRHELTRTVGVEWEPIHNGVAEISGMDRDVLRHFSRRSEEIRDRMRHLGMTTARAAELATLETRRAKDYDVPVNRLRDEWRARASEMGLGREELDAVLDRRAAGRPLVPDPKVVGRWLQAPGGITRESSTFDRRDVLRDFAEAHREGATVADLERLADAWLESPAAIALEPTGNRFAGARYSTPELLRLEREVIDGARERRGSGAAVAEAPYVDAALAAWPMLSEEQVALVRSLTTSGDGVQVVRAAAGTGKTFAVAAARDAWEASGIPVYGCSVAARAALELETLTGIDSTTIARLRADLDRGYGLERGAVLVVDEAGMAGTRAVAELAEHAAAAGGKIVLLGDDRQLPELDAGGAFRGLAERLGCDELRDVRRQQDEWDRDALAALRRGNVDEWSEAYRAKGRIVARPSARDARETLVSDWWESAQKPGVDAVMLAHRRCDVADLNARARARMRADGRLSAEEVSVDGRAFAVGDRVVARRNDRAIGIVNGARGVVTGLSEERTAVTVRTDSGDVVEIGTPYLEEGKLDHGYALTAHAAQGATVDRAYVLGSDDLYREWGYTALTRHREEAKFYVVSPGSTERCLPGLEPEGDPIATQLRETLGHSRRKELAAEVLERGYREIDLDAADAADGRGPEHRVHAARQLEEIERDLVQIRAELQGVSRWNRARRAQLSEAAAAHELAAMNWREQLELATSLEPPHRTELTTPGIDPEQLRAMTVDPTPTIQNMIGARPESLFERESWTRAAARLVDADLDVDLAPTATPLVLADTGLDL